MNEGRLRVERALEHFARRDGRNDEAFGRLCDATRPVLTGYLRLKGLDRDDVEDVVEGALMKIWERRDVLSFPDVAHWFGYMKRVVDRAVIDLHRGGRAKLEADSVPLQDVSDDRARSFVHDIADALERCELDRAADRLWLGEEPPEFTTKLLAAKMVVLDGQDPRSVAQIVRRIRDAGPVDETGRSVLEWAAEVRVVRSLAGDALSYSGPDLARIVLGCASDTLADAVGKVGSGRAPDLGGFTSEEVAIVVWKFYCFEPTTQVARRAEDAGLSVQVDRTIERCGPRLPFLPVMRLVWDSLRETPTREPALTTPGLWKRLAFHYAAQGLPHLDLVAWLGPAAEVAGFRLETMTVHAWISNRRLAKELIAFLRRASPEVARA
ncbi:MAG: hypothetical protein JST30_16900 [Armatimonadetes bacterium]|nr:hypothetical protein [Armatimonadota bacterium]